MLPVTTVDIDGEQWEIQDAALREMFGEFLQRYKNDMELSDYESITIGTSSQTATEMEFDGFISFVYGNGGSVYGTAAVYVNDVMVAANTGIRARNGETYNTWGNTIVVKKGDKVYFTAPVLGGAYARFYKKRTY